MQRLGIILGVFIITLAMTTSPHTSVVASIAYAGGDSADRSLDSKSGPKSSKKKSKFEIHAENLEDTYRAHGMRYYFTKKSRMRRLLKRLYEEKKAGEKHIWEKLKGISINGLGLKDAKKYKPEWAQKIMSVSTYYNEYKDGNFKKANYEARARVLLGFVP